MINPNEAPDGFVAVKAPAHSWACLSCAFKTDDARCLDSACYKGSRKDRTSVIFIPRKKSNLAEFPAIGELAEARAETESHKHAVNNLTIELADLIKKNDALEKKVFNQRERIRHLEGATNHATGTPLSKAKDEAAGWKSSHDYVCRELASCENARDENARLCEEARDEAAKWRSACRDRDDLIAKLKAQLTTALESIARMR